MFNIRKAEIKDIPAIAKVHVRTWQVHYRGQMPDEYLDNLSVQEKTDKWQKNLASLKSNESVFVLEDLDQILGFCWVGPSRDDKDEDDSGSLYAIYVLPDNQGKGFGSALMKVGLDFLRSQGFIRATLWVLKSNITSIKFYESQGWKFDGAELDDQRDGFVLHEIRYGLDL